MHAVQGKKSVWQLHFSPVLHLDRTPENQRCLYSCEGVCGSCVAGVWTPCRTHSVVDVLPAETCLWLGFLHPKEAVLGILKTATCDLWRIYPGASHKTCPNIGKLLCQMYLCGRDLRIFSQSYICHETPVKSNLENLFCGNTFLPCSFKGICTPEFSSAICRAFSLSSSVHCTWSLKN